MRKWHRWLVLVAGLIMLWIAATGFAGQVLSLAGGEHHDGPPPAAPRAPGGSAGGATSRPGRTDDTAGAGHHDRPPHDLYHLIIDLHSGNYFGTVGKVISAFAGGALLFFSVSGMWMYVDMFRKRRKIGRSGILWD